MEHFKEQEPNYEEYRQGLLFECDRLALISMASQIGSQEHTEVNQDIQDIKDAWEQDTQDTLF